MRWFISAVGADVKVLIGGLVALPLESNQSNEFDSRWARDRAGAELIGGKLLQDSGIYCRRVFPNICIHLGVAGGNIGGGPGPGEKTSGYFPFR